MKKGRKPLDAKFEEFIQTGNIPSAAQDNAQHTEKRLTQEVPQANEKTPTQRFIADIIPPAPRKTKRLSVDFPDDLYDELTKLSKECGLPKTEIVRRLVAKALHE